MTRDIVVIGASAGGVEAPCKLVGNLPGSLSAGVFVVLHPDPHTPSTLHEILDRSGPLRVLPAEDGARIEPGVANMSACPPAEAPTPITGKSAGVSRPLGGQHLPMRRSLHRAARVGGSSVTLHFSRMRGRGCQSSVLY